MSCYVYPDGTVDGWMPNGEIQEFNSVDDYEDAFLDMEYEMDNEHFVEYPEYA